MIPPPESSITKEQEKNDGASLLPVDPSASQSGTEALPYKQRPMFGPVTSWHQAALLLGEGLAANGPEGYYDFTPYEWLTWARAVLGSGNQAANDHSASPRRSAAQKTSITDQAEGAEGR